MLPSSASISSWHGGPWRGKTWQLLMYPKYLGGRGNPDSVRMAVWTGVMVVMEDSWVGGWAHDSCSMLNTDDVVVLCHYQRYICLHMQTVLVIDGSFGG